MKYFIANAAWQPPGPSRVPGSILSSPIQNTLYSFACLLRSITMAHKKVERRKELDRRRHRRAQRLKQRIHEAKNKKD